LVGFGSGIDSGKNYPELIEFAKNLPQASGKRSFVFSISGMPVGVSGENRVVEYTGKCHKKLKEILETKGYVVEAEFGCPGYNTNKFLKYFGGLNKGRPNEDDLKNAAEFALKLKN
jgi:flavodoxin